jgi:hypothetical protein
MEKVIKVIFYLSKYSPKESKKRSPVGSDFYIVDITKLIKDLGYELDNLTNESEFIINYTIRKKITQGIYSTKSDGILVCYKSLNDDFVENLEDFLDESETTIEYTIHNL